MTQLKNNIYFGACLSFMAICLFIGLGPCIIGGFISYWLIVAVDEQLAKTNKLSPHLRTMWSFLIVGGIISVVFFLLFKSIGSIVRENKVEQMLQSIILILEDSRAWLPLAIWENIPKDVLALKNVMVDLLKTHTDLIATYGKSVFKFLGLAIVGMIIGIIFSFSKSKKTTISAESDGYILKTHIQNFASNFKIIIFSQFWVALFNTAASILYLSVVLPMFDVHVPYKNVAIITTFCASLIPIFGNLISNTLIALLSLSVSLQVAICSLFYLMFIHKFEYLIVARVFGGQIQCRIWEILCAIIFMEAFFGLPGLIMAPVLYTFIKQHLLAIGFFGAQKTQNLDAQVLVVPSYEQVEKVEKANTAEIEVPSNERNAKK